MQTIGGAAVLVGLLPHLRPSAHSDVLGALVHLPKGCGSSTTATSSALALATGCPAVAATGAGPLSLAAVLRKRTVDRPLTTPRPPASQQTGLVAQETRGRSTTAPWASSGRSVLRI